ncbi:MAG: DUF4231 domain-containing protein [Planctomycetota bacterium]
MNTPIEYPSVFRAADKAASAQQREYLRWSRTQLIALIGVAVVSGTQYAAAAGHAQFINKGLALLTIALTVLVLLAGLRLRIERIDDKWFHCRALAENVKGLVWQYAMGVLRDPEAESQYFQAVRRLQSRLLFAQQCISQEGTAGDWITGWMRGLRGASLAERVAALRAHRIADQRAWYDGKAAINARLENRWASTLLGLELLALLAASIQAYFVLVGSDESLININGVSIIAALAASALAWIQLKRFSDLVHTYRIAADDLAHLDLQAELLEKEVQGPAPPSDAEARLHELVKRVETAVSREHSLWLGQHVA